MAVLDEASSPRRFSRVLEQVKGVSQKLLTKTLRLLEQDGLVERTIFAEVPPRVEYGLRTLAARSWVRSTRLILDRDQHRTYRKR